MAFFAGVAKNEVEFQARLISFMTGAPQVGAMTYVGTGNGRITSFRLPVSMFNELIEITCTVAGTDEAEFSVVVDSVTQLSATTNTIYSVNGLSFMIEVGTIDYQIGDKFTIAAQGNVICTNYTKDTLPYFFYETTDAAVTETITLQCTTGSSLHADAINYELAEFSVTGSVSGLSGTTLVQGTPTLAAGVHFDLPDKTDQPFVVGDQIIIPLGSNQIATDGHAWDVVHSERTTFDTQYTTEENFDCYQKIILRGYGNGATEEVLVGFEKRVYQDQESIYYLSGFTGFDGGSSYDNQLGYLGDETCPLIAVWPNEVTYWVSVNGRRAVGVINNGGVYEHFYLGLCLPHCSPTHQPYPLAVGGSLIKSALYKGLDGYQGQWQKQHFVHTAYFNPYPNSFSTSYSIGSQLAFYGKDGGAQQAGYEYKTNYTTTTQNFWFNGADCVVIPYNLRGMSRVKQNFDATYTPFPIWIAGSDRSQDSVRARMDGIFAVTGDGGLNSENLVVQGDTHFLVFQNTTNVADGDYMALEIK